MAKVGNLGYKEFMYGCFKLKVVLFQTSKYCFQALEMFLKGG